jgi:hypothetical protein
MEKLNVAKAKPVSGQVKKNQPEFDEQKFFPSGAIAFFVVLVMLGLVIWFGIYFLMLERI